MPQDKHVDGGTNAAMDLALNTELICAAVPIEHRGVLFERVLPGFAPYGTVRRRELAFAQLWAKRNSGRGGENLLVTLLLPEGGDELKSNVPCTAREWVVARTVAATIAQWLGTPVGMGFVTEGLRRAGYPSQNDV